ATLCAISLVRVIAKVQKILKPKCRRVSRRSGAPTQRSVRPREQLHPVSKTTLLFASTETGPVPGTLLFRHLPELIRRGIRTKLSCPRHLGRSIPALRRCAP